MRALPQSVDSAASCRKRAWRPRSWTLFSLSFRKLSKGCVVTGCPAACFIRIHNNSSSEKQHSRPNFSIDQVLHNPCSTQGNVTRSKASSNPLHSPHFSFFRSRRARQLPTKLSTKANFATLQKCRQRRPFCWKHLEPRVRVTNCASRNPESLKQCTQEAINWASFPSLSVLSPLNEVRALSWQALPP